jgi:hypothetical protein
MRAIRKAILCATMLIAVSPAFALNDTIGVTVGSGKTANLIKFGSGNVISETGICDATTENQCASVSAGGAVKVDASATTQPVSGTVAATESGTWTVQPGNTANTTPWLATISQGGNSVAVKAGNTAGITDVGAVVADPNVLAALQASTPAGTATIGSTYSLPYPLNATPYTATATGTTGATTATLAGASSVTTYLCGFSIRANATAAATGNATVTGVITATLNFTQWTAPNASGLGITEMIFQPCIPASGTNQSIAVVSAAPGTGGVVSVTAWGFKL